MSAQQLRQEQRSNCGYYSLPCFSVYALLLTPFNCASKRIAAAMLWRFVNTNRIRFFTGRVAVLLLGPPLVLCGLGQSQRVLPHSLVEEKRVRMGYVVDSDAIWETQMNGWGGATKWVEDWERKWGGKEQEAQTAFKNECFSVPLLCSQVVAVHMWLCAHPSE